MPSKPFSASDAPTRSPRQQHRSPSRGLRTAPHPVQGELMPTPRGVLSAFLASVVGLTVTSCAGDRDRRGQPTTASSAGQTTPRQSSTASRTTSPTNQEAQMKIQITIGDQRFHATVFDSPAGRDLIGQLPLTVDMIDHGTVEKTGPLPSPLSLDGQPEGADPDVGDVGYYAPGNDLVLYYGNQSYFPGIVIIGRLDGDAASRIADLDGAITATVEPRAA